jgi:hypothetical protein
MDQLPVELVIKILEWLSELDLEIVAQCNMRMQRAVRTILMDRVSVKVGTITAHIALSYPDRPVHSSRPFRPFRPFRAIRPFNYIGTRAINGAFVMGN